MPSSAHLMDPELAHALEGVPSFDYSAETIGAMRPTVAALALDAPPAPGITTEEQFIDGPDGNQIRILVSAPVDGPRTGAMLCCTAAARSSAVRMATPRRTATSP